MSLVAPQNDMHASISMVQTEGLDSIERHWMSQVATDATNRGMCRIKIDTNETTHMMSGLPRAILYTAQHACRRLPQNILYIILPASHVATMHCKLHALVTGKAARCEAICTNMYASPSSSQQKGSNPSAHHTTRKVSFISPRIRGLMNVRCWTLNPLKRPSWMLAGPAAGRRHCNLSSNMQPARSPLIKIPNFVSKVAAN